MKSALEVATTSGRCRSHDLDGHYQRMSVSVVAPPRFEPTTCSLRTISRPAARNFPYDIAAETTIGALGAWAPAKRSVTLLLTLIGFLIACRR